MLSRDIMQVDGKFHGGHPYLMHTASWNVVLSIGDKFVAFHCQGYEPARCSFLFGDKCQPKILQKICLLSHSALIFSSLEHCWARWCLTPCCCPGTLLRWLSCWRISSHMLRDVTFTFAEDRVQDRAVRPVAVAAGCRKVIRPVIMATGLGSKRSKVKGHVGTAIQHLYLGWNQAAS